MLMLPPLIATLITSVCFGCVAQTACAELSYSLEQMEDFLSTGDYPEELVTLVMGKTGCQDRAAVVDKLKPQRLALLQKVGGWDPG